MFPHPPTFATESTRSLTGGVPRRPSSIASLSGNNRPGSAAGQGPDHAGANSPAPSPLLYTATANLDPAHELQLLQQRQQQLLRLQLEQAESSPTPTEANPVRPAPALQLDGQDMPPQIAILPPSPEGAPSPLYRPDGSDGGPRSPPPTLARPFESGRPPLLDYSLKRGETIADLQARIDADKRELEPDNWDTFSKRFVFYAPETGAIEADTFLRLKVDPSGKNPTSFALEDLLRLPCFWLDITCPAEEEMRLLATIFHIHPLTVEDIQTDNSREKFELYKTYYFICYSAIENDPQSPNFMESYDVYSLVYSKFILTFHHKPLTCLQRVLKRLQQINTYVDHLTPHWINYSILDDITDRYEPLVESTQNEVDTIDDLVLILSQAEQGDMLRRIANVRKRQMILQRLMISKADVLRALMKRLESMVLLRDTTQPDSPGKMQIAPIRDTALYLGDVQDHVITMVQNLSESSNTLSRAHSNYLASITIEITQASNMTNDGMSKLTVIASILVPLNVITGLWGMNVRVPGQDVENESWFFGIVAGMIMVVVASYAIVRFYGIMGTAKKL